MDMSETVNDKAIKRRLLTEAQAAEFLGVSRSFLRKSRMTGQVENHAEPPPFVKAGRMIRYILDDLESWIEKHRCCP